MKVAISVDWDFFFNDTMMDWGHQENLFFIDVIWGTRALDLKLAGQTYEPSGIDEFLHMFNTLGIKIPALYVAESHLYANGLYSSFPPDLLVNFDSHADMSAKHPEYLDCENWLYWLLKRDRKLKAVWVVPKHASYNQEIGSNTHFTAINYDAFENWWRRLNAPELMLGYMCRSGAWTPPWSDERFLKFLNELSPKLVWHQGQQLTKRECHIPDDKEVEEYKIKLGWIRDGKIKTSN